MGRKLPRRLYCSAVAGALTVALLAIAPAAEAPVEAAAQAIVAPAVPRGLHAPELVAPLTESSIRSAAIAMVTGLTLEVAGAITREADRYGLQDDWLVGIIAHETGETFDPLLVAQNTNGSRDFGLMQLNSGTYPWIARRLKLGQTDPLTPDQNIRMGTWYLNYVLGLCDRDLACGLSHYNGDSTGRYSARVVARIEYYRGLLQLAAEHLKATRHQPPLEFRPTQPSLRSA